MNNPQPRPSLEDVLDAFAMEPDTGRKTIERYLQAYPEYASELVDLSRTLARSSEPFDGALSAEEVGLIEDAWRRHEAAVPRQAENPLAHLSVPVLREIAGKLGVPRQVLTAFRERRVLLASVPDRFLTQLAAAAASTVDAFRNWLEPSSMPMLARSYKSDGKPAEVVQVPFDRILLDAQVPPERRAELLSETD